MIHSNMKKYLFLSLFAVAAFCMPAIAQIKTPPASPTAKISQEVGLIKVDLEYSRPSTKGRKIFGDLVPYGDMWRTGANASTKISFSDDVKVNGQPLPKGNYALYTIPGEKEWTIIFYKNTSFWGTPGKDFKEEDVALKVKANSSQMPFAIETLTIDLSNLTNNSFGVSIVWEKTSVTFQVTMDTDTKVQADIKTQLEGPSAGTYYSAARYYFDEKKDMAKALEWVNKAVEKSEKFYMVRLKAQIQAELGQYKDAIATAERSTVLAKAEANTDYPRMNDKSIAEWKKKM
jgi:hypothetical protein